MNMHKLVAEAFLDCHGMTIDSRLLGDRYMVAVKGKGRAMVFSTKENTDYGVTTRKAALGTSQALVAALKAHHTFFKGYTPVPAEAIVQLLQPCQWGTGPDLNPILEEFDNYLWGKA